MDSVLRHLNVLGSAHRFEPNELFVMTTDRAHEEVRTEVDEIVGRDGIVVDGVADLEELRLDPLVTAGWRPMVLLSPPVAVLVSALGYLAYLLLLSRRSGSEMGMLRTIGVSRGQFMGLLTFENVMIAGVGIGLGSWARLPGQRHDGHAPGGDRDGQGSRPALPSAHQLGTHGPHLRGPRPRPRRLPCSYWPAASGASTSTA